MVKNSILGSVKNSDGSPLKNICVNVSNFSDGNWVGGGVTDEDGQFSFSVPKGEYYITTDVLCGGSNPQNYYIDQCWNGSAGDENCGNVSPINITYDSTVPSIAFTLRKGSLVAGTIKDKTAGSVSDVCVNVFSGQACGGVWAGGATSDENGEYSFLAPQGEYYVAADPSCHGDQEYLINWWDNETGSPYCNQARSLNLAEGTTSSLNFTLVNESRVSGTADTTSDLSVEGLTVNISSVDGHSYYDQSEIQNGGFELAGLPLGTYNIDVDVQGTDFIPLSIQVEISEENQTVPVHLELVQGGTLSGMVAGMDNRPIDGVWIEVWSEKCWNRWLGGAFSDENGDYRVTNLPPGEAFVRTCSECDENDYIDLWWMGENGSDICSYAQPVAIVPGEETQDINFVLAGKPKRTAWSDVMVSDGKLSASFDILPGFNQLIRSADLIFPGGNVIEFDLLNDVFVWENECNQIDAWSHDFDGDVEYGQYVFRIEFKDGHQETYAHMLEQISLVPVDSATIALTIQNDGSMDFAWNNPESSSNQVYQVRIYKDGERFYKSSNTAGESLTATVEELRCLTLGQEYTLEVRVYDDNDPSNAFQKSSLVSFIYNPGALVNRAKWFTVSKVQGTGASPVDHLSLYFNTRYGSKEKIVSARVTGPDGFIPYDFDIENDWYDKSTETRTNSGWHHSVIPDPGLNGHYHLSLEFEGGYSESHDFILSSDYLLPVAETTMGYDIYKDGSMSFQWDLPSNVINQKYRLRIRSLDDAKEFYSPGEEVDTTQKYVDFWNLRGLVHGQSYQWFIKTYSLDSDTVVNGPSSIFTYDPFNIDFYFLVDLDEDGDQDGSDIAMFCSQLIQGSNHIDIAEFAAHFGK